MYEWNTRIRYSETGTGGKLTLAGLINLFQDCSNFHSEDLGLGLSWLTERNLGWIILKWQVEINRYPDLGEKVTICTSPYSFRSSFAQRCFLMKDEAGEMIACADSMWMAVDLESLKPIPISEDMAAKYGEGERFPMDHSRKKIVLPEGAKELEHFTITRAHLDSNNHVNNGQYITMAMPYLNPSREAEKFMIEYRNQAFLGDEFVPVFGEDSEKGVLTFNNTENVPYAIMQLIYRV